MFAHIAATRECPSTVYMNPPIIMVGMDPILFVMKCLKSDMSEDRGKFNAIFRDCFLSASSILIHTPQREKPHFTHTAKFFLL